MKRSSEGVARGGRSTMKAVAAKAGVALGTVSRVINGYPDVDPGFRARVESAIRELGYRRSDPGRGQQRAASPLIGYILGNREMLNRFHSGILQGVEQYCNEAGYLVVYSEFHYKPDTKPSELLLPRILRTHGLADCLILAGTNYENFIEALEQIRVPHVLLANNLVVQRERVPVDQVRFDDATGAYEAVRYLIELGHRQVWYIGDISLPWSHVKYESYRRAMAHFGLQPQAQTVGLADDYYANGYRSMKHILQSKRPVTAVLTNDDGALGAWNALTEAGLHVPEDVSLVGFGDNENVQVTVPPMTSVRIDRREIGRQLAKMAIHKIQFPGEKISEVLIPTTLIKRGTTRPVLVPEQEAEDPSAVEAVL
jgi:LacI family transcriptional regulator